MDKPQIRPTTYALTVDTDTGEKTLLSCVSNGVMYNVFGHGNKTKILSLVHANNIDEFNISVDDKTIERYNRFVESPKGYFIAAFHNAFLANQFLFGKTHQELTDEQVYFLIDSSRAWLSEMLLNDISLVSLWAIFYGNLYEVIPAPYVDDVMSLIATIFDTCYTERDIHEYTPHVNMRWVLDYDKKESTTDDFDDTFWDDALSFIDDDYDNEDDSNALYSFQ